MSLKASSGSKGRRASQNDKLLLPLGITAGVLVIYLLMMIVYGGWGGKYFAYFSSLTFLQTSSNKYYASEAEMKKSRALWKQKGKTPATSTAKPKQASETATSKSVNGVVLYAADYEARDNLEAEIKGEGDPTDENSSENKEASNSDDEDFELSEKEKAEALKQKRLALAAVDEKSAEEGDESEASESEEEEEEEGNNDQLAALQNTELANNSTNSTDFLSLDSFSSDQRLLKSKPATHAFNVGIVSVDADICNHLERADIASVFFRKGRSTIKSFSLDGLDALVTLQRDCTTSKIIIMAEPNADNDSNGDNSLHQRRQDEIKYYLLQRRVAREAIATMEEL